MTSIVKANQHDFRLLAEIGKLSFIESHGHSATKEIIDQYVNKKYTEEEAHKELSNPENSYFFILHNGKPAGYSKIVLNASHPNIAEKNVTKLDRLYVLKEFYDLKLGLQLFNFNLDLSESAQQSGMWLFVWTENQRAVNFYTKAGFKMIAAYNFKLTENHSNPNHQMFLRY